MRTLTQALSSYACLVSLPKIPPCGWKKKVEDRPKPLIGRSAFAGLRHGSRAICMPGRVKDSETCRPLILYDYTTGEYSRFASLYHSTLAEKPLAQFIDISSVASICFVTNKVVLDNLFRSSVHVHLSKLLHKDSNLSVRDISFCPLLRNCDVTLTNCFCRLNTFKAF